MSSYKVYLFLFISLKASTDALLNALTVFYNGGMTNTQAAIQNISDTMYNVENGGSASNTDVMVIITDGR